MHALQQGRSRAKFAIINSHRGTSLISFRALQERTEREGLLKRNLGPGGVDAGRVARSHELATFVQHVFDLFPKIGGNIIAGLLKPQLDHASRVVSITRNGGWINGNCGQCLERIEGGPPG